MITNRNTKIGRRSARKGKPVVILAVGVLLFIILVFSFFPMTRKIKDDEYIRELEARVSNLETRLTELGPVIETWKKGDASEGMLERLSARYQRLEGTLTLKSNLLAGRLDGLEGRVRSVENIQKQLKTSENGKGPAAVERETQTAKKKGVYHVVEKGDTFYAISRKYGMSLSRLRELNRFSETTKIYPGQKIIINP